MRQSSSSIMFVLLFLTLTAWIIWVAVQDKTEEEIDGPVPEKAKFWSEIEGDIIRYKSYNDKGEWTLEVQAQKIEQVPGHGTAISGTKALYRRPNGKVLRISADLLKEEGENRVFSSKAGNKIIMEEVGGFRCETAGPLVVTPQSEFITQSHTTFVVGLSTGDCLSLYYRPDEELKLTNQVAFKLSSGVGASTLEAQEIHLVFSEGLGHVRHGHFQMISTGNDQTKGAAYFEAEQMILHFTGGQDSIPFNIREIETMGPNSQLFWNEGSLKAPYISICMDQDGRFPQMISTFDKTEFSLTSLEGRTLRGLTGGLYLDFFETRPLSLIGDSALSLHSESVEGSKLELTGGKGFSTEFSEGRANNTRIFGAPVFEFEDFRGQAGFFRILHGQRKLMLSQTAELVHTSRNISVSAEEILVSNWDTQDREIFGRAFIRFKSVFKSQTMEGTGDEVFFSDFQEHLTLKGRPATFQGENGIFSSDSISVRGSQNDLHLIHAQGNVQGSMVLGSASDRTNTEAIYELSCQDLIYDGLAKTCRLRDVDKLSSEEVGSLSGELVEFFFLDSPGQKLKNIQVRGKVYVTGTTQQNGVSKKFSGQSDTLDFDAVAQILTLEGENRDVTLQHDMGYESRGRRLIYSLRDATMRVEAGEHSSTQTIVNIKKEKSK